MQLNKFKHIKEDLMQKVYSFFRSTKDLIVTVICLYTTAIQLHDFFTGWQK